MSYVNPKCNLDQCLSLNLPGLHVNQVSSSTSSAADNLISAFQLKEGVFTFTLHFECTRFISHLAKS